MNRRFTLLTLCLALAGVVGYWLAKSAAPQVVSKHAASSQIRAEVAPTMPKDEALPKFRRAERAVTVAVDSTAQAARAIAGERVVIFKDQASLEDFLKRAGGGIRLLDRLDALHAVRVGFAGDDDALAALLGGKESLALIFPVEVPPSRDGTAQAGAVPSADGLLAGLGITGDNSAWGKGVLIAILDTGVMAHTAFQSLITRLDLVGKFDPAGQNDHATTVASMIISQDLRAPGVAPGASILSIRIADDRGRSDSFLLAKGIIAAVDGGARILNISLGSSGDSGLVRTALEYAKTAGALVIAAAGNQGENRISYPAANPSVIAVGAVDGVGEHLDFSNTGAQLALTAAGFEINAATSGNRFTRASGTSFSSPIVAGLVAAVMSQSGQRLTPQQAYGQVLRYLNDAGAAGPDPVYGGGTPDIGRVLNGTRPGVYDAAVASQRITAATAGAPFGQIEILVQNRGTMALTNIAVETSTAAGLVRSNITSLLPNAVYTLQLPIPQPAGSNTAALRYDTNLRLSGGIIDSKPSNNRRVDQYVPAGN
jgi:subtilisin family serine protease